MAKGTDVISTGESEKVHAVIQSLNPGQQVVIQKLLKSVVGTRLGTKDGDWLLEGVKVSLTDQEIKMEGLNCEQSGQPRDGRGQSLVDLSIAEGLRPKASGVGSTYRLNVEFGSDSLGGVNEADFVVLFGEKLARTLAFAAVAQGELGEVAVVPDPVSRVAGGGEALSAALEDGRPVSESVRRALGGGEIEE